MSKSIDRQETRRRQDRLPWSVCLPVMIILSLVSWILIVLAFRVF